MIPICPTAAIKLANSFMKISRDRAGDRAQGKPRSEFSEGVALARWMSARDVLMVAGMALPEINKLCGEKPPTEPADAPAEQSLPLGGS